MNEPSESNPKEYFDFEKLAHICEELNFKYEQSDVDVFKIFLRDDIPLFFINDIEKKDTIIDMGAQSHIHETNSVHGRYDNTFTIHYLDIPLLLRTGDLLVWESYKDNQLFNRWFLHYTELYDPESLDCNNPLHSILYDDEIHIINLSKNS